MKKYSRNLNYDTNQISSRFIAENSIQDITVRVTEMGFTDMTRSNIDINGNCYIIEPMIYFKFETERGTKFTECFYIDTLMNYIHDIEEYRKFERFVSCFDVHWNNFTNIIGESITISSPIGCEYIKPSNTYCGDFKLDSLAISNPSELYHPSVDDYLVDFIVNLITNKKYGYCEPVEFVKTTDQFTRIKFKLHTGHTFTNDFVINDNNKESNKSHMSKTPIFSTDTGKHYSFWNLCRDAIGYIPTDKNYDKILGNQLDVCYFQGRWLLESIVEKEYDINIEYLKES